MVLSYLRKSNRFSWSWLGLIVFCLTAQAVELEKAQPLNAQLAANNTLATDSTVTYFFELPQPQYIRVQAIGAALQSLTYYNAQGQAGKQSVQTPLRLERLALPAGRHYLELKGAGPYILKAIELGAVPVGTPFEAVRTDTTSPPPAIPCSTEPEASTTPFSLALPSCIQGKLDQANTQDHYTFRISEAQAQQSLTITTHLSKGPFTTVTLKNAQGQTLQTRSLAEAQTAILSPLVFSAGDYAFSVQSLTGDAEYEIKLTLNAQPHTGLEVEPNDTADSAVPLADDYSIQGHWHGDEQDTYTFEVKGELQLWQIEVVGKGAQQLRQYDNAGHEVLNRSRTTGEAIRAKHLLLLPGRNLIAVTGKDSNYTLKVTPLGPPQQNDPNRPAGLIEQEPNDTETQAELLRFNETRIGLLAETDDWDTYYFTLHNEETITLTATTGAKGRISRLKVDNLPEAMGELDQPLLWTQALSAGVHYVYLKADPISEAHYQLTLTRPEATRHTALDLKLTTPLPPLAAFWLQGQTTPAELTLSNASDQVQTVKLHVQTSHTKVAAQLANTPLELAPQSTKTLPITLQALPDLSADDPIRVTVQAQDATTQQTLAEAHLDWAVHCDAPPLNPHYIAPLPSVLLGGFNLAASAWGTRIVQPVGNDSNKLIDGTTSMLSTWQAKPNDSITLELPHPATIHGFILNPLGNSHTEQRLKQFRIASSTDGTTFTPVLEAALSTVAQEQTFVLANPLQARFVQLTVLTNQGQTDDIRLGEFKVISAATDAPKPYLNIADPTFGGYLVMSDPLQADAYQLLSVDQRAPSIQLSAEQSHATWIIGFQHNRAAQIERIQWLKPNTPSAFPQLTKLMVEVSTDSPLGPWQALGEWPLTQELVLTQPTWARFIRFTATGLKPDSNYHLAEAIHILERPVDAEYYSILGEWGENERQAIFEYLAPLAHTPATYEPDVNEQASQATPLQPDHPINNQVTVQTDIDWYRFQLDTARQVTIALSNHPTLRATAQLYSAQQEPIAATLESNAHTLKLSAHLVAGDYFLQVSEPPRAVVFAWDNSGSMATYTDVLYRSITRFVQAVKPEVEVVQLQPFASSGSGKALLQDWSGEPSLLLSALNNYTRADSSSDSEGALISANELLAARQGGRAILLLTDAESTGYPLTPALWQSFNQTKPSIYSLLVDLADQAYPQDLMQSWADVNGGYYSLARHQADLALGFSRASCQLRRAAPYQLALHLADPTPAQPAFGFLWIKAPPTSASTSTDSESMLSNQAIEIILDASGSMLEKVGDKTKIAIAKQVLNDLVKNTLPAQAPFALRVYGHKKAGCGSDLEIPLQPLDRTNTQATLKAIQPQLKGKTPLADSILKAAEDLKGSDKATLILLTDGKESCGGKVEQAIQQLRAQQIAVQLSIIGLGIDEEALKQEFRAWAQLGGGVFLEANDAQALKSVLTAVISLPFDVLQGDKVVGRGTVGSEKLSLPIGTYDIRYANGQTVKGITIIKDQVTELNSR